jgi:hypothetical protein
MNGPVQRRGGVGVALLCGVAVIGAGAALANGDMGSAPPIVAVSPEAEADTSLTEVMQAVPAGEPVQTPEAVAEAEPQPLLQGIEDGAKALFCENLGFMSFVKGLDERLRSPQFPGASVQSTDGLIVLTSALEIQGITAEQSSYLTRGVEDRWTFTGFRGTEPVADRCTDITKDLAGSFRDLALAASWGMPEVERRVALFDALEDDLRTRLELAELERDALLTDSDTMRQQVAGLTTELVTARMAICEIATQTQGLLTNASFGPEGGTPPAGFAELLAEASTMSECIAGTTMTVGTSQEP